MAPAIFGYGLYNGGPGHSKFQIKLTFKNSHVNT